VFTKEQIQSELEKFVLNITAAEIVSRNADFVEALEFNELDELDLIMEIEKRFDIAMPDVMFSCPTKPKLSTINSTAEYIYSELMKERV
jgi:acyl carrier protein